jgi:hypothetical protein
MTRLARSAALRSRAHFTDIPSLAAISSMVAPAASFSISLRSRFAISRFVARRGFDPGFAVFPSAYCTSVFLLIVRSNIAQLFFFGKKLFRFFHIPNRHGGARPSSHPTRRPRAAPSASGALGTVERREDNEN